MLDLKGLKVKEERLALQAQPVRPGPRANKVELVLEEKLVKVDHQDLKANKAFKDLKVKTKLYHCSLLSTYFQQAHLV